MQSSDLATVLQIERNTQRVPWGRLVFEESLTRSESRDGVGYICEVLDDPDRQTCDEGPTCVAFLVLSHVLDELHIMNLAVAQSAQGLGFGHVIMDRVFYCAERLQLAKVFLEVRKSNTGAIRLYEKWGFEQLSVRGNYYRTEAAGKFEDALIYCRQLTKTVSA